MGNRRKLDRFLPAKAERVIIITNGRVKQTSIFFFLFFKIKVLDLMVTRRRVVYFYYTTSCCSVVQLVRRCAFIYKIPLDSFITLQKELIINWTKHSIVAPLRLGFRVQCIYSAAQHNVGSYFRYINHVKIVINRMRITRNCTAVGLARCAFTKLADADNSQWVWNWFRVN